ncbi:hypothetical protein [Candidatus Glomeribacter gigasporarum]|uniref:hypothetical protein n=1 Tax=Candidatus Glomeribacter gigasporarum TaxID=132144 RepID=UPI0002EF3F33|nr:hypothetical protein [Candidatus Glomeribacter gigasporarum]
MKEMIQFRVAVFHLTPVHPIQALGHTVYGIANDGRTGRHTVSLVDAPRDHVTDG